MQDVEIKVADSPIPNAIDQYYNFLLQLLRPTNNQDVALNSTIVTFDIVKEAHLYTQGVFRAFADRTITISPTNFEPGAGNIGDRFSERYVDMIGIILSTIDRDLKPEDIDKITSHKKTISVLETDLSDTYTKMATLWGQYAESNHINKGDEDYLDKMVAYYNTFNFSNKIKNAKNDILSNYIAIDDIRQKAYPDNDTRQLSNIYRFGFDEGYKMIRPYEPTLEAKYHYDEIKLAQAWVYGNIGNGSFDIGQEVLPSGDLEYFLDRVGKRGFSITKGASVDQTHEAHWHTSGSASWTFFSASVGADHADKWNSLIKKNNKIEISFENIAEYWVRRGRWYDSTIFDFKIIKDFLKNDPLLATKLSYAISSVVIGRGLTITLTFDDTDEFSEWSSTAVSSGGGFSIFGIGASGNNTYNQSDFKHTVDTLNKSVTFFDGPDHTRLLGFRVEKLFQFDEKKRANEFLTWEEIHGDKIELLSEGKLTVNELIHNTDKSNFFTKATFMMNQSEEIKDK